MEKRAIREEAFNLIQSGVSYSEVSNRLGLTKGSIAQIVFKQRRALGIPLLSRSQVASKGGKAVPNDRRSFSQNRALASQAGRKGGQNCADEKRSFSKNRDLAAMAGRKGGQASHGGRPRAVESVA